MSEVNFFEFEHLSNKFLALSMREQVLLFVAGIAVITLLFYTFLLEPTLYRTDSLTVKLTSAKDQQQITKKNIDSLTGEFKANPNIAVRQRIESLNQQIAALDKQLLSQTSNLVPANQMAKVLERVLVSSKGIKLIGLESITPTPLFLNSANDDTNETQADLYRHGVNLIFEGKYFEIQSYLQQLESLQWQFYWKKFDYQVVKYPLSRVELEIYTVSTSKAFIGV